MPNPNQNQNQNPNQNRTQNQNPHQNRNQNQNPNQNRNQNQNQNNNRNGNTQIDYSLKETSPNLNAVRSSFSKDRVATTFDLVESMDYLYIRVVKAKELPPKDPDNNINPDPLIEVKNGNFKAVTKNYENTQNPEWNQVFCFLKDRIQSHSLDIFVKDKSHSGETDFLGKIIFEIIDIPKRVPPDSPLAPQWYRLLDRTGQRVNGELMLAVWFGNQADEAFPDAWHLDSSSVSGDGVSNIRSKVYLSPKLWYLRVNVIEAQDLNISNNNNRVPEIFVKAVFGNMVMKSKISVSTNNRNINPMWNEDLMFVASEPFDDEVALSVEDRVGPNKDEMVGKCRILLDTVERRSDSRGVSSKWYNLEKKDNTVVGRIHMRVSLDGGYHVLDELTQYCSDFRATNRDLNRPSVGVLELGILSASGLLGMKKKDNRDSTDAYCVAKYGQKWVRTRTIIDSCNPKWNEQYTWEVFDPCTVITIVVFDNCHLVGERNGGGAKDARIGKVRIRLSMLETDHIYTHSYPLIVLQNNGLKKMGEIQLAVRFSISSLINVLQLYSTPLLPKMHYIYPLTVFQQDSLRHQSTQIIAIRMCRAEPPLRKEVVEYMLDVGSHMWSLRKSRANIFRITEIFKRLIEIVKWFDEVQSWKNPFQTVFVHVLCLMMVIQPKIFFMTVLVVILFFGAINYRKRIKHPPYMDARLSLADRANFDDLDEEFDNFPTNKQGDILKARYDRLRCIGARIQAVIGDLATQGERVHALLSWRDTRATGIFMLFCLVLAILMFFTPIWLMCVLGIFYVLRHPRFRRKMPSSPFNFFRRLPTKADSLF